MRILYLGLCVVFLQCGRSNTPANNAAPQTYREELKQFEENPEEYLSAKVHQRIWRTADADSNALRITALMPTELEIPRGQWGRLKVRAVRGVPVTFSSRDLGRFRNNATTITVQADSSGIAVTEISSTPGTVADIHVVAASPATAGQVHFNIVISETSRIN